MALGKLRTDFKDDIINTDISENRRYIMITNSDGTISLQDVTTYSQIGDEYGAQQINKLNGTVNEVIDMVEGQMDFILINQSIIPFTDNVFSVSDSRITSDSLADVYFTDASESIAKKADITVDTYDGRVELVAKRNPEGTIVASIRVRVVE